MKKKLIVIYKVVKILRIPPHNIIFFLFRWSKRWLLEKNQRNGRNQKSKMAGKKILDIWHFENFILDGNLKCSRTKMGPTRLNYYLFLLATKVMKSTRFWSTSGPWSWSQRFYWSEGRSKSRLKTVSWTMFRKF
jgi:hypothetical protein